MDALPAARAAAGRPRPGRLGTMLVMVVAAVLILAAYLANDQPAAEGLTSARAGAAGGPPIVGQAAPDFTATTIDGSTISMLAGPPRLADVRCQLVPALPGGEPDIQATYARSKAQGLVVVEVFIEEDSAAVRLRRRGSGSPSQGRRPTEPDRRRTTGSSASRPLLHRSRRDRPRRRIGRDPRRDGALVNEVLTADGGIPASREWTSRSSTGRPPPAARASRRRHRPWLRRHPAPRRHPPAAAACWAACLGAPASESRAGEGSSPSSSWVGPGDHVVGGVTVSQWTETADFCGRCHTMGRSFSHAVSPHRELSCAECHVEPGVAGWIKAKINGTRQLFEVITGSFPTPIPPPEHDELPPTTVTCRRCHDVEQLVDNGSSSCSDRLRGGREEHTPVRGAGDPADLRDVSDVTRPPLAHGVRRRVLERGPAHQTIDYVKVTARTGRSTSSSRRTRSRWPRMSSRTSRGSRPRSRTGWTASTATTASATGPPIRASAGRRAHDRQDRSRAAVHQAAGDADPRGRLPEPGDRGCAIDGLRDFYPLKYPLDASTKAAAISRPRPGQGHLPLVGDAGDEGQRGHLPGQPGPPGLPGLLPLP